MNVVDTSRAESGGAAGPVGTTRLSGNVATSLTLLSCLAFLVSLDRFMVSPLLPAISQSVHASIGATGLIVTAYGIPYGLFQIAYGPLADRFGKVAVVRVVVLLFAVGTIGCGLSGDLISLTLLRLTTGAFAACVYPMTLAYIGDVVPMSGRQQAIGNLVTFTSIATALSPAIGGIIADLLNWRDLFLLCGGLTFVPAGLLFRVAQPARRGGSGRGTRALFAPFGVVLRSRSALAIDVLVCVEGALTSGLTYLGAFLHDVYHADYTRIGLLIGVYGVGTMVTAKFIGRAAAMVSSGGLVLIGALLLASSYLMLLGPRSQPLFAASMLVMGLGWVLCHSTLQTRITEAVPGLRATAVAMFAFFLFLGNGAGTAVLSVLVTVSGYDAVLIACGVGLAVFALTGTIVVRTFVTPAQPRA